jgi:hypothetical protein
VNSNICQIEKGRGEKNQKSANFFSLATKKNFFFPWQQGDLACVALAALGQRTRAQCGDENSDDFSLHVARQDVWGHSQFKGFFSKKVFFFSFRSQTDSTQL